MSIKDKFKKLVTVDENVSAWETNPKFTQPQEMKPTSSANSDQPLIKSPIARASILTACVALKVLCSTNKDDSSNNKIAYFDDNMTGYDKNGQALW